MESLQSDAIQESTRAGQALEFRESKVPEQVRKIEASGSGMVIYTPLISTQTAEVGRSV